MPQKKNDDLFEQSKMTIGEHLDELRGALVKAVSWLFIGFLIGLYFGKPTVDLMQKPLVDAMRRHYTKISGERYKLAIQERRDKGEAIPEAINAEDVMVEDRLMFEETYILRDELNAVLNGNAPTSPEETSVSDEKVSPRKKDMVRLFLWKPMADDPRLAVKSLNVTEPFMIFVKAALLVGFLIASPGIFWALWSFVAAGLYPHEKRYVNIFLPMSLGLFFAGAALAFFVVFGFVLDWLFSFNAWLGIDPDPRINEWLGFVLFLPIGFGISFQLPLVMFFLERVGIVQLKMYTEKWKIAVLTIAVIAMVLTPADPMSMILMGIPLLFLYGVGILLCKYMPRGRSLFDAIDAE